MWSAADQLRTTRGSWFPVFSRATCIPALIVVSRALNLTCTYAGGGQRHATGHGALRSPQA
eukprot:3909978-Amphidinium_carterae.1